MEYQVEELSPVKKKVKVQVPAEEVDASISTTAAFFKKDLKLSGFRKGKVPQSIVESRFKEDITKQASQDLLNIHFNQIFGELGVEPLTGVSIEDIGKMERGKDLDYTFSFEIMPEIDLPEYYGLKVEQRKPSIKEEMIDRTISRIQRENSTLDIVSDLRYPKTGDIAVISFAAYKGGELFKDIQAQNFELPLDEGQALQEFEEIVKGLYPGQSGEGEVSFPEDFLNKDLAGQTLNMKVTLHSIKERKLPEVDDHLAKKAGGQETVQELRDTIRKNLENYFMKIEKSMVQKKLLNQISSQVEVTIPDSLLQAQLDKMIKDKETRLEQQGKNIDSEGGEEALKEEMRPEAEDVVKGQLILLAIAKKEELSVSNQEVDQYIYQMAVNQNEDATALRDYYEKNNLMFAIRDSILADKAAELIYNKAEIEEVEPDMNKAESSSDQEGGDQASVQEDEKVSSEE